ncbi:hypothetical protein V2J09_023240 [Rumex salicifolius]
MPIPEKVLNDEFVVARKEVRFPNGIDGEPEIVIGQEVLDAMAGLWKNYMFVKVLGRSMPLSLIDRKLREVWKPNGGMSVVDFPRRFFLVRFDLEADYLDALTGGPQKIFGNHILVDMATLKFERGKFARICIEVNLSKPLKGSLTINDTRYFVTYEGLNTICSHCGIYGHLAANCSKKRVSSNGEIGTTVGGK